SRDPERPALRDPRDVRGAPLFHEGGRDTREGVLRLPGHGNVRAALPEDEGVVRANLRAADQHLGARRPALHLAREVQAALAVPEIERESDEVRLLARNPIGEQRIAGASVAAGSMTSTS